MNKQHHVNNAKAIISLLILAIAFVIYYKFTSNQAYFAQDPNATRNYIVFAIIGGGFLIGLLYLTSNTTHKTPSKPKAVKASKSSKAATTKKKKK